MPLATGARYWWHWWLNIALFVPVGFTWTLLTRRPRAVVFATLGLVVAIETLHATVLSGAGDPTDVIANMLGTSAGIGIASVLRRNGDVNDPLIAQRYRDEVRSQ